MALCACNKWLLISCLLCTLFSNSINDYRSDTLAYTGLSWDVCADPFSYGVMAESDDGSKTEREKEALRLLAHVPR